MKTIQMKTLACGPTGNYLLEEIYNVDDNFANDLIAGRFAVLVGLAPEEPPAEEPPAEE